MMSCRTGPLRAERPLRDLCTFLRWGLMLGSGLCPVLFD